MEKVVIEHNVEITTSYRRQYNWRNDPNGGFGFPCDEHGNVDAVMNPLAAENYRKCLSGEHDVVDAGVDVFVNRIRLCPCGSGEYPEDLDDARGIFIARCCNKCKAEKMRGYRPEIFTDSQYECDEQIEADY